MPIPLPWLKNLYAHASPSSVQTSPYQNLPLSRIYDEAEAILYSLFQRTALLEAPACPDSPVPPNSTGHHYHLRTALFQNLHHQLQLGANEFVAEHYHLDRTSQSSPAPYPAVS